MSVPIAGTKLSSLTVYPLQGDPDNVTWATGLAIAPDGVTGYWYDAHFQRMVKLDFTQNPPTSTVLETAGAIPSNLETCPALVSLDGGTYYIGLSGNLYAFDVGTSTSSLIAAFAGDITNPDYFHGWRGGKIIATSGSARGIFLVDPVTAAVTTLVVTPYFAARNAYYDGSKYLYCALSIGGAGSSSILLRWDLDAPERSFIIGGVTSDIGGTDLTYINLFKQVWGTGDSADIGPIASDGSYLYVSNLHLLAQINLAQDITQVPVALTPDDIWAYQYMVYVPGIQGLCLLTLTSGLVVV